MDNKEQTITVREGLSMLTSNEMWNAKTPEEQRVELQRIHEEMERQRRFRLAGEEQQNLRNQLGSKENGHEST